MHTPAGLWQRVRARLDSNGQIIAGGRIFIFGWEPPRLSDSAVDYVAYEFDYAVDSALDSSWLSH